MNDPASDEASLPGNEWVSVQLVYAQPDQVWSVKLTLQVGTTVAQALQASGFYQQFPQIQPESLRVGIFGRECSVQQGVNAEDRIEIYRPLVFDPMESRRRRAAHKKSVMNRPSARARRKRPQGNLG